MLAIELIAQINGKPDFITLSEDGRWVAIHSGGEQRLFDSHTGREHGRVQHPGVISPDGNLRANMRDGVIQIFSIDGNKTLSASQRRIPRD